MSYSGAALGSIQQASGCGACGSSVVTDRSHCSDFGSEWTYDSYGSCNSCGFNCLGTLCTAGTHANCRKFQYTGSPNQCCLNQQPTGYPNTTCDPSYTPLSANCSTIVQNYCGIGSNIFTDPICISWAAQNPTQANVLSANYCTPSMIKSDQNCRSWVASSNIQGTIDNLMVTEYCQNNPTDTLCSCIMSEIPCPNKFDNTCIQDGGYKTKDMMTVTCPNVLNCNQYITLSPGAKAVAVNFEQNCGTTQTTAAIATIFDSLWSDHKNLLIIALIFLIFSIVLVLVYTYQSDRIDISN